MPMGEEAVYLPDHYNETGLSRKGFGIWFDRCPTTNMRLGALRREVEAGAERRTAPGREEKVTSES